MMDFTPEEQAIIDSQGDIFSAPENVVSLRKPQEPPLQAEQTRKLALEHDVTRNEVRSDRALFPEKKPLYSEISKLPHIQEIIAEHPDIVAEQTDELGFFEEQFRMIDDRWDSGEKYTELTDLKVRMRRGDVLTHQQKDRFNELEEFQRTYVPWGSTSYGKTIFPTIAQSIPFIADSMWQGKDEAVQAAAIAGAASAITGPGAVPTMGAAGLFGLTAGMYNRMSEMFAAEAYYDLKSKAVDTDIPDEVIQNTADAIGIAQGLLNTVGLGYVGKKTITEPIGGFMKKSLTEMMKIPSYKKALVEFMTGTGKSMLAEGSEEGAEVIMQFFGEQYLKTAHDERFAAQGWSDTWEEFQHSFIAGTQFGLGANIASMPYRAPMAYSDIQKANNNANKIKELADSARDSKLKDISPDVEQAHIKKASEGRKIYVPSAKLRELFQASGLEDAQIRETMPETFSELENDTAAVPMDEYLRYVARSEHYGIVEGYESFNVGDPSLKEVEHEIDVNNTFIEAIKEHKGISEKDELYQHINDILTDMGTPGDVAHVYAQQMTAGFNRLAQEYGRTPMEHFNHSPVYINQEGMKIQVAPGHTLMGSRIQAMKDGFKISDKDIYGKTFSEVVKEKGGIQDVGGELANADLPVNPEGMALDDAVTVAREEGFINWGEGVDAVADNSVIDLLLAEGRTDSPLRQGMVDAGRKNTELENQRNTLDYLEDISSNLDINWDLPAEAIADIIRGYEDALMKGASNNEAIADSMAERAMYAEYEVDTEGLQTFNQGLDLKGFAAKVAEEVGLKTFLLSEDRNGDILLSTIIVDKADRKEGRGTKAMEMLAKYADRNGRRLVLEPAQADDFQATTSRSRLVKFYKRFGFIESKGRNMDYELGAGKMWRDPKGQSTMYQSLDVESTAEFKAWSEGAQVIEPKDINDHDFSGGEAAVLKVFHGTTHEFSAFNAEGGNVENQFGKVNYFTSSFYDADSNYAGEGPDLTNRLDREAESSADEIQDVIDNEGIEAAREKWNITEEEFDEDTTEMAKNIARRTLAGGMDQVMEVYVKITNPFVIGGEKQWIDLVDMDAISEEAIERVADNEGVTPAELDREAFEDEIQEANYEIMDETENPLIEAINTVAERFDIDPSSLLEQVYGFEEDATALEEVMRDNEAVMYADDETGALAGNQVIAEVIQEMGFDGIILKNASERFSNMGIEDGTSHIHIFHEDRANIKSQQNEGGFSVSDDNIFHQESKGSITFPASREWFTINLTKDKDLSTFIHETGHLFFEMLHMAAQRPGASQQIVDDYNSMLAFSKAESYESMTTEQLELMARAYEAYVREGVSPSIELEGAFAKMKAWMERVYSIVESLKVSLTDEVRGVFDRLLANDEAITEMEQARGFTPSLASLENIFTPSQAKMIKRLHTRAHEQTTTELDRKAFEEARKIQNGERKAQRIVIEKEVDAEMLASDQFNIPFILRRGKALDGAAVPPQQSVKLSVKDVNARAAGASKQLSGMTSVKGGKNIQAVASAFGYRDADSFLDMLLSAPKRSEYRAAAIESRMLDRHGDILKDDKNFIKANAAYENDAVAMSILEELGALGDSVGGTSVGAAIKAVARKHIDEQIEQRISVHKYRSAELRAAKAAFSAAQNGNLDKAYEEKRKHLLNHYMARYAQAAKDDAVKTKTFLKRMAKPPAQKILGLAGFDPDTGVSDFQQAMGRLLSTVDVRTRRKAEVEAWIAYDEFATKYEDDGVVAITPPAKSIQQLTVAEIGSLYDAARNIYTTASAINKVQTQQGKMERAEFIQAFSDSATENTKRIERGRDYLENKTKRGIKEFLSNVDAGIAKVEFMLKQIDGGVAGLSHSVIFQPFVAAQHKKIVMMEDMTKTVLDPIQKYAAKNAGRWVQEVNFLGTPMQRKNVLVVALNVGNKGNLEKMLAAHGWSESQLREELNRVLSEQEFDLVQNIWDSIHKYWKPQQQVYLKVTGIEAPGVEASTWQTKYGTLRGGYFPIIYDPEESYRMQDSDIVVTAQGAMQKQTIQQRMNTGMMQERMSIKKPNKFLFKLDKLGVQMEDTAHLITHFEAASNVGKVIRDPAFRKVVEEAFTPAHYRAFQSWLSNVSVPNPKQADGGIERAVLWARTGTSVAAMGMDVSSTLMQAFGVFTTMSRLKPKYFTSGLVKTFSPEMRRFAEENSNELPDTVKIGNYDVRRATSVLNQMGVKNKPKQWYSNVVNTMFLPIMIMQKQVNIAAWIGGYEQALAEGHPDPTAYADSTIRTTQAGGGNKDLSTFQTKRGTSEIFTMFLTFMMTLYNMVAEDISMAKKGPKEILPAAMRLAVLLVIPVIVEAIARGEEPEDDEGYAAWISLKTLEYGLGTIPVIGPAINSLYSDYGYSATPIESQVKNFGRTAAKIFDEDDWTEKDWNNLWKTTTFITRTPASSMYELYHRAMNADDYETFGDIVFGIRKDN